MFHAKYGGSNAERWLHCHGYLQLAATVPRPPTSQAALEGTACHTVMEELLADPDKQPADFLGATIDGVQITPRHVAALDIAVAAIDGLLDEVYPKARIWSERYYSFVDRLAGGTADVTLIWPTHIAIVDFKFGNLEVKADAVQLRFYLASLLRSHPELCKDVREFEAVIVQPTFEPALIIHTYTAKDVRRFAREFDAAIRQGEKGLPSYREGRWCEYCPAAIVCPLKTLPNPTLANDTHSLDVAALAKWWLEWKRLEPAAAEVKARLHRELEHGAKVEGVKLVNKRTDPQWNDPATAAQALDLTPEQIFSVLTPNQVKRIIPGLPPDLIHDPAGGTTIAVADDERTESPAAGAFEEAARLLRTK